MLCDSRVSLLAHNLATPCLGHKPKARVVTLNMPVVQNFMNNSNLMHSLIMNNLQMWDIIDHNPDLTHILNAPKTL
jgi:ubiquilin